MKKLLEKAFKENNFKLLEKENLNQIPHQIITNQLKVNDEIKLCDWLFKNGIDYNEKDKAGNTGLMLACFMKKIDFVKLYLSYNAEINNPNGLTALMLSLEGLVNEKIVELLLKHNPDIDTTTNYDNTEISAITLAYQNTNIKLFEKLLNKSDNPKQHQILIESIPQKYPRSIMKDLKLKDELLNNLIKKQINNYYNKEPLKTLKQFIKLYDIKEQIELIITSLKDKNITCINKERNEYLYSDSKVQILYIKENDEINIIDILVHEETIHPEIKKERLKKAKELNEKIKQYNNSFKINLGYERELDNQKVTKIKEPKETKTNKKTNQKPTQYKPNDYYKYNIHNIENTILNLHNQVKTNQYSINYLDEIDFRKKERAVKKYNMLAYKKLMFNYYPDLRKGAFQGLEVQRNEIEKISHYELELPTPELFKKVHGPIVLHYTICEKNKVLLLTNITPEEILEEGHKEELNTYKGVLISKTNKEKDMFKINLLNMLGK